MEKMFLRKQAVILISWVMVAAIIAGRMIPFSVTAADATSLTAQINGIPGLTAEQNGSDVDVTGSADTTATLTLNIDPDVTVNWKAALSNTTNNTAITLTNSGTFNVADGGAVISGKAGYAVYITGSDAKVNVNAGGTVRLTSSASSGENSAIRIAAGVTGTEITVNSGGAVISDDKGYAVNDGVFGVIANNDTKIVINGGIVTAGTACAIHSTSARTTVEVRGGLVSNAAGNNLNPAIQIDAAAGEDFDNIFISGGTVQAASTGGYAVQTTGNVLVSGGLITAQNGRAINLVGQYSKAVVSGGGIYGTGANVISTATTNPETVPNTEVTVTGGTIANKGNGNAINITGANSKVSVSTGGTVTAGNGNAINMESSASGASVTVNGGGYVRATGTGSAVYIVGSSAGTSVTVNGGQVTAGTGYAIRATNAAVEVNGGFVFAYGTALNHVIIATNLLPAGLVGSESAVCAWNHTAGTPSYSGDGPPHTYNDLALFSPGALGSAIFWHNHPLLGGGINYVRGPNATGFFPLPVIVSFDYGLIFDAATGVMYKNLDGTGSLVSNTVRFYVGLNMFNPPAGAWVGEQGKLTLNGFSWITTAPVALTVVNGDTEIVLNGDGTFQGADTGIVTNGNSITIDGNKTLFAKGSEADGIGLDIDDGNLIITGGALVAQGGSQAILWDTNANPTGSDVGGPTGSLYSWAWSQNYNGGGPPAEKGDSGGGGTWNEGVYPQDAAFAYFPTDLYVKLQALRPVALIGAVQVGGVPGKADSGAIMLTFDTPITGLTADGVTIANGTGTVQKGAELTGSGAIWTIALDGIAAEGDVSVSVRSFSDFYIAPDTVNPVPVYKADLFGLTINAGPGGKVSGDETGLFFEGTPIEATAVPDSGFYFTGWTVTGAAIAGGNGANPAAFNMPANAVTLTANFAADPIPPPPVYVLTISPPTNGRVTGTVPGSYGEGAKIQVRADADDGYIFTGWTVADTSGTLPATVTANPYAFDMPAGAVTLTANFKAVSPLYSLTVNTAVGGTVGGTASGEYSEGEPISVTASAGTDYIFRYWIVTDGSNTFINGSTANPAAFNMPANDVTLTPYFVPYNDLTVIAGPNGGVSGTASGKYRVGTPIEATAVPDSGFYFTGWTVTGAAIAGGNGANPAAFNMPANAVTLTANFAAVPPPSPSPVYVLTINPPTNGRVTGTVPGSYEEGAKIQVRAAADDGYIFTGWTVADTSGTLPATVTANPYAFDMPAGAVTLTANFKAVSSPGPSPDPSPNPSPDPSPNPSPNPSPDPGESPNPSPIPGSPNEPIVSNPKTGDDLIPTVWVIGLILAGVLSSAAALWKKRRYTL
jgi:uncharacterized repeat protein (TIGR02543 family)